MGGSTPLWHICIGRGCLSWVCGSSYIFLRIRCFFATWLAVCSRSYWYLYASNYNLDIPSTCVGRFTEDFRCGPKPFVPSSCGIIEGMPSALFSLKSDLDRTCLHPLPRVFLFTPIASVSVSPCSLLDTVTLFPSCLFQALLTSLVFLLCQRFETNPNHYDSSTHL
jgi:hypothetical protein